MHMEVKVNDSKLIILLRSQIYLIPLNEILFIEHFDRKIYINLEGIEYQFHYSLKKLEDILPKNFKRTHRSFIVNKNLINKLRMVNDSTYEAFFTSEKQALVSKEFIMDII